MEGNTVRELKRKIERNKKKGIIGENDSEVKEIEKERSERQE